jgi:hypothetical protein
MNTDPTIPCPVCHAPIYVRYLMVPNGDVARVYAEPLLSDDETISFHQHQMNDVQLKALN